MSKKTRGELDALIEEITVDAYGEQEQLWAIRQALADNIHVPFAATVIGEPVQVTKFDYDGNERRGLTATCRRADGSKHVVAASEVILSSDVKRGEYLAAYRRWMGIAPYPASTPQTKDRDVGTNRPERSGSIEVAILSVKQRAARCRLLDSCEIVTLRTGRLWEIVPGEIAHVKIGKQWIYGGNPYLSGIIESTRLDAKALGLTPLRVHEWGIWKPEEQHWGDPGEPVESWAKPIIARGPRPQFEMEQVLPGEDPDDPMTDPIIEANDHKEAGDYQGAREILMEICRADLRCLDAHAHLGNLLFDSRAGDAIRHYEVGFRIGEWSLGDKIEGVLPWGCIDNRPFLRCMHGFGLCLWRLGRFEECLRIFKRMLWLNPTDNQGIRMMIGQVRARERWEDYQ